MNNEENKPISAFAYFTARQIEDIINNNTDNLKEHNQMLEALILEFRGKLEKHFTGLTQEFIVREYDNHFKIITFRGYPNNERR